MPALSLALLSVLHGAVLLCMTSGLESHEGSRPLKFLCQNCAKSRTLKWVERDGNGWKGCANLLILRGLAPVGQGF